MTPEKSDPFLEKYLAKYDKWLGAGEISYASKVVPVRESLDAKQWIIPNEQALEILGSAKTIALNNCICRSHYKRCDHPIEVCFLLDELAVKRVEKQTARYVDLQEARDVLREADKSGLVHLTFYMPGHKMYAFCSCCDCCCHDLQLMWQYRRSDLIARSEYIALTDMEACTACGECIDRCYFNARALNGDQMDYEPEACYGCGLCVNICPEKATTLTRISR